MYVSSTVTGIPVRSEYPPMNVKKDMIPKENDGPVHEDSTINIMWTRAAAISQRTWTTDHFVPLLKKDIPNKIWTQLSLTAFALLSVQHKWPTTSLILPPTAPQRQ